MTIKTLDLLVVEDTLKNINRAKEDLSNQGNLVVVQTYKEAIKALKERSFDVVITDERIPFAKQPEYPIESYDAFTGKPLPFGARIVLYSLAKNTPYISMITDTNHHDDEIAAAQDDLLWLCKATGRRSPITIGNSKYLEGDGKFISIDDGVKKYRELFDLLTGQNGK